MISSGFILFEKRKCRRNVFIFSSKIRNVNELLKMLEKNTLKFIQLNPLVDLAIAPNAVFPTVMAFIQNEMSKKIKDAGAKLRKAEKKMEYVSKHEKHKDLFQKTHIEENAKTDREFHTYYLVYFNPETKKADIIEGTVLLEYEDETQQVIEESLGQRSAYSIYSMIAMPLIREQVDEQLLQEIKDKIKIETPDPFGGGTPVHISSETVSKKIIEEYGDKIIALEVAEKRKQMLEEKMAAQIMVADSVVKKLESNNQNIRKLLEVLPPLSRARMLALFRKGKRISKKQIRELLIKDIKFLSAVKSKLSSMRAEDVLKTVLKIKNDKK